jgi:hypothetical protein
VPDKKLNQVDPEQVFNTIIPLNEKLIPGFFEKAVPFNDPEL